MSLADIVAPNLPYLRRFARALSGDQGGGDAYVEALLEMIIADPSLIRTADGRSKVALYRVLCRLWESISLNRRAEPGSAWERAAQAHLTQLAPRPRQAFLLTTVENFSLDDAAEILGVDRHEVVGLVSEASREIGEMIATDVLIIEDEPLIAMDLQDIVNGLGHKVSAIARTRSEALEMAHAGARPGIILADIHLADGSSGLDAVNDLLREFQVPVVFITAFPERLLTGARPEPAFLITKPFAPDTVKAMIGQALFFDRKARRTEAERALHS